MAKKTHPIYEKVSAFLSKYPSTVAFRAKAHSKVLEGYLNPDEKVDYAFIGQKNDRSIAIPNTFVVAITNKRLILGRKRLLFGHFFYSITPDLFNDMKVKSGIIWGKVIIDTVKELVTISNISKASLDEIETEVTERMIREKRKWFQNKNKDM
jgi:hypothetical protein